MGKITIKDLAVMTGLSQATISLSLRDHPRIPDSTKQRVLRVAREAGYVYNRQAANLRMSRTRTVAICLNTIQNPVISRISTGLLHCFQSHDWMVMFGDSEDSKEKQAAFINTAVEYNVGGLIVVPAVGTEIDDLKQHAGIVPMVLAVRELAQNLLDQVRIDYEGGVSAAIDHLVTLSHRRIGWIGGGLATQTSRAGLTAFRSRLHHHRIKEREEWIRPCLISRQAGFDAMQILLLNEARPTAVLCFSDVLASGAMHALREAGLTPGREMSVVGFDDLDEARFMTPPLTTVKIDQPALGLAAGELLLNRIADPAMPRQVKTVPAELVVRETSGPAPKS
jgi:LacI family transcriptional regulator